VSGEMAASMAVRVHEAVIIKINQACFLSSSAGRPFLEM